MSWYKKIAVLALFFTLLGSLPAMAGTLPPEQTPWGKVDPLVQQALQGDDEIEFLVVLRERADLSGAQHLSSKEAKGWFVYQSLRGVAERTQAGVRAYLDERGIPYRAYYVVNLIWVQAAGGEVVLDLAGRPEVERILPNPHVRGIPEQPASLQGESPDTVEWNIAHVHADDVWALGYTGQGAVVAGNDTGIDWDHPALINQYRPQYPGYGRHDFNWHDAIANQQVPYDGHGHGTHTLGTMIGDDGGTNQIGMAPGAHWIGCKNMTDSGVGTPASYIECFDFFLAPYAWNDPPSADPSKAPHVINNSWSCPPSEGCSADTLEAAVDALRAAGIEVVVSAGNGGSGCSSVNNPPAIYQQSFSVGATNSSDIIASFSSRGPVSYGGDIYLKPEISAPGVNIRSSVPGGGYQGGWSGTSMAAPHVAGLVALLLSVDPGLAGQPDLIEQVITSTAVPRPDAQCGDAGPPNNVYGWGIIDALAAVQTVLPQQGTLEGTVTEMGSGDPIQGATVQMVRPGGTYEATTDASGFYSRTLPVGTYTVTASASGYLPATVTGVTILTDTTTTQDFALEPLPSCEPVTGADFVWEPPTPTAGQVVTFTGSASGTTPISYTWAFGDGATASGAVVTHAYAQGGDYTVVMTATNCQTATATVVHTVTVAPAACQPVHDVDFTWAPTMPLVFETVTFTGTAAGSLPITYTWDFGDGATGSGVVVTHTYTWVPDPDMLVLMTATNCQTSTATVVHTVTVTPLPCAVYIITVTPEISGCVVTFSAEVTGSGGIVYQWDFAAFGTSSETNPVMDFGSDGTYPYTLTVFTCDGSFSDTYASEVTVACLSIWHAYLPMVYRNSAP